MIKINKYILDLYIFNAMEVSVWPLSFMKILQNNNYQADTKILSA